MKTSNFDAVLESVVSLSIEDQEALLDAVKRHFIDRRRATIAAAKEAHQAGQVVRGTIDEATDELD